MKKAPLLVSLMLTLIWLATLGSLTFPPQTDVYPRLIGTRELFLRGLSPYSQAVTAEIQTGFYGRRVKAGEAKDEQRFVYPLYVSFLLLPLLPFDIGTVNYLMIAVLVALTIAISAIWLRLIDWKLKGRDTIVLMTAILLSIPVLQELRIQNLVLLVVAFLTFGIYAATRGRFGVAGLLLALATIKPQACAIPILWLFVWCFRDWPRRKRLVFAFTASLAVLFAVSFLLVPTWFSEFLLGVMAYRNYFGVGKSEFGLAASAILACGLIPLFWSRALRDDSFSELVRLSALAMAYQFLVLWLLSAPGIPAPYQAVLLLPLALCWMNRLALREPERN